VDSILNPEHFPLVSRERPTPPLHQVAGQHRRRTKPRQRTPRR
jgi:hypothetical protein